MDVSEYREAVLRFADAVEAVYEKSPREESEEDFRRAGYAAFWTEWHRRRGAHT